MTGTKEHNSEKMKQEDRPKQDELSKRDRQPCADYDMLDEYLRLRARHNPGDADKMYTKLMERLREPAADEQRFT